MGSRNPSLVSPLECANMGLSRLMKSRSVTVEDQLLDLQLECRFWECLDEIIESLGTTLQCLVSQFCSTRPEDLASDLRVFVLQHYQREASADMTRMVAASSAGRRNH